MSWQRLGICESSFVLRGVGIVSLLVLGWFFRMIVIAEMYENLGRYSGSKLDGILSARLLG